MDLLTLFYILVRLILLIGVIVILVRTFQYPIQTDDPDPIVLAEIDGEEVAKHIGLAIQMKTINDIDTDKVDPLPFQGLHNLISMLYPEVEEYLTREVIGDYSLLYTWQGNNPDLSGHDKLWKRLGDERRTRGTAAGARQGRCPSMDTVPLCLPGACQRQAHRCHQLK